MRRQLADYAGAEHRGQGKRQTRYMTWRLADQAAATRHRLRRLGFAAGALGDAPVAPLALPARLALAATALAMLALTAFGVGGYRWWQPELPVLVVQDDFSQHKAFKAQTVQIIEPIGPGTFEVTLGSARYTERVVVEAGATIPVTWEWTQTPNSEELQGSVVLNAGRLAQPIRACHKGWPLRSLVVIAAPFQGEASQGARQLAIRLLDKGSADAVLMGEQWAKALPDWLGDHRTLNRRTQVLAILPPGANAEAAARALRNHPGPWAVGSSGDFASLAKDMKAVKGQALQEALPTLDVHRQQQAVRVSGGPEKTEQHGIEWVRVCPGTFTMRTINKEEDRMADDDEIVDPPRTVVLSGFDMAATETTETQYGGKGVTPKVDINWEDARKFCRQEIKDGDLPTEAQWEYAARGGSRFPWSFGDDETLLKHYAWYGEGFSGKSHEVKQKLHNPFGLYDMHGNVWEWTREAFDNYKSGVFVNPRESDGICKFSKGIDSCVLRGGSFDDSPGDLRSASRVGLEPENWSRSIGFRCVRVPPSS